jgi:DNA-binding SARP family transcriptional activator
MVPALADAGTDEWIKAQRARREELRLPPLEERIEDDLALERHAELVPELQTLIASHPLRERPREQRMDALYRPGRQVDAPDVLRATRRQLVDEPGSELRRLERMILTYDPTLRDAARSLRHEADRVGQRDRRAPAGDRRHP